MPNNENRDNDRDNIKNQFFHAQAKYHGEFSPEALTFNANLQEFASRVGIVCNLETGGKISSEEAYAEIKQLWKQLKQSKHELLDVPRPPSPDLPPEE